MKISSDFILTVSALHANFLEYNTDVLSKPSDTLSDSFVKETFLKDTGKICDLTCFNVFEVTYRQYTLLISQFLFDLISQNTSVLAPEIQS